jgi:hypothetical protein
MLVLFVREKGQVLQEEQRAVGKGGGEECRRGIVCCKREGGVVRRRHSREKEPPAARDLLAKWRSRLSPKGCRPGVIKPKPCVMSHLEGLHLGDQTRQLAHSKAPLQPGKGQLWEENERTNGGIRQIILELLLVPALF